MLKSAVALRKRSLLSTASTIWNTKQKPASEQGVQRGLGGASAIQVKIRGTCR